MAGRITVQRNGIDLDTFRPQARDENAGYTIVSAGHLINRKGHDLVIRALKEVPGVDLLIAGEGPRRRELEALARQLGVLDRVRFLGSVAYAEMPALFAAADLTVLASNREGWANVLLESMACGTPVVATNVGGAPELICEPAAGLLVDDRTPSSISAAIKALLSKPPSRGSNACPCRKVQLGRHHRRAAQDFR